MDLELSGSESPFRNVPGSGSTTPQVQAILMKRPLMVLSLALGAALLSTVVACKSGNMDDGGVKGGMMKMPFGGAEDMDRASSLWSRMANYRNWSSPVGLEGFQKGRSPHGKYLKYYVNGIARSNPNAPGAIVVKENYMAKMSDSLGAITVMEKIPGYDAENKDWFWVKYMKDGSVAKNGKQMSLAGRVAKGMSKGCIACHGNAGGGDYLFIND